MSDLKRLKEEMELHLTKKVIPFWRNLRDDTFGGYYGYMGYDLQVDRKAVKSCILNSRITWFFSNAYLTLREDFLLEEARHGYRYLRDHCLDKEYGGVFWSTSYDGSAEETIKHTYNQAFAIYALSSYFDASGEEEALMTALQLYELIESRCKDEEGYLEAFDRQFIPVDNEKLSENGVMAEKTMNTLLHVFEAYTELLRVLKSGKNRKETRRVRESLRWILDIFSEKVYNPELHRQEVFFDKHMNSIIDLHSYGHDIETAWLIDRGVEVLEEEAYGIRMQPIVRDLEQQIYKVAFRNSSLSNECEKGVVNTHRIWWVQAETVVGFLNAWQKQPGRKEYLEAALSVWEFIKTYMIDPREGSEWFWEVEETGRPYPDRPIVEPWKCPYHNGRMCLEVIARLQIND